MQIRTDQHKKELKQHGTYDFPVLVSHESLSAFDRGYFFWHWHPEIEFTYVEQGDICYQIGNQIYYLQPHQGLFCNSNMPHTGRKWKSPDCTYISITFDPRIIYGYESSLIQKKYVHPIIQNSLLESLWLLPDKDWQANLLSALHQIQTIYDFPEPTRELDIQRLLSEAWGILYKHLLPLPEETPRQTKEKDRILKILSFIHGHYQESLTLDDLASEIHLCKGECSRLFKKHMKVSPFDYLLQYRIEQSLPLLAETDQNITEVALQCGFSSSGYFSRIFRRLISCTPREYRKTAGGYNSSKIGV